MTLPRDSGTSLRHDRIEHAPAAYEDENITPEELRAKRLAVIHECNYDKEESRYWLTALGLIPDKYPEPPNWNSTNMRSRRNRPKRPKA